MLPHLHSLDIPQTQIISLIFLTTDPKRLQLSSARLVAGVSAGLNPDQIGANSRSSAAARRLQTARPHSHEGFHLRLIVTVVFQ